MLREVTTPTLDGDECVTASMSTADETADLLSQLSSPLDSAARLRALAGVWSKIEHDLSLDGAITLTKCDGVYVVERAGGDQRVGASLSAGDTLGDALMCAFDLDLSSTQ